MDLGGRYCLQLSSMLVTQGKEFNPEGRSFI